jgi:hypothetical protein
MGAMHLAFALQLVLLHAPDGHEVAVNPAEITHMHAKRDASGDKYFTKEAQCMINLSDGKFVTVIESCEIVRKLIKEGQP